jgi:DNA-binding transcriptional ArsR family regulator
MQGVTHPIPVIAEGTAAAQLRLAPPSLVAAITTGMAMVDYALAGDTTPTPGPQAMAHELPPDVVEASHPVRAAVAHGTALRSYLLGQIPPDHPGHEDWPALREWLAVFDTSAVKALLAYGIADVLGYRKPPGTTPTAADVGASDDTMRRHAIPVLAAWAVTEPERRAGELLDSASVLDALLALLDAVWEGWLAREWTDRLPALRAAAHAAPPPPPGCDGPQWIRLVTGLRPDRQYAEAVDRAARVTLMPCPGLGRSLSLFWLQTDDLPAGDACVLYTPGPPDHEPPDRQVRAGISVQRLGQLAPVLHGLGDRTRLAIVLHLLDQGPQSMPELADALRVHQSTVSRQVTALRRAQVVDVDEQRRVVVDRTTLRRVGHTLLETLE